MMRAAPKISINLCCYNSERYLRETLESIIGQTWQDWELVIVNDGSTDGTESIIREYQERGYPIVYHHQSNRGLAFSRNQAIELSRGDFIAFIDHDDLWLKDKLEKQVRIIREETSDLGLIYTRTDYFKDDGEQGEVPKKYLGTNLPEGRVLKALLLENNFITLSSAVVSKESCVSVGGFPNHYQYAEDYYLFSAIASTYKVRCEQSVCCMYRIHDSNTTLAQKTRGCAEVLDIFFTWSPFLGEQISQNERDWRVREINTLMGALMIKYDKQYLNGLKHIISKGSFFSLFKHLVDHHS
jgi:glycosyltransferase involved in cell wall biosynthesis